MLYDPKWKAPEVETDPLTLEAMAAWLETKKPGQRYDYENCSGRCLYGQYMKYLGIPWDESGAASSTVSGKKRADFCALVYMEVASQRPWTFGDALERAREALGK